MINTLLGINRQIERIEKIFEEISVKNVPNFMKNASLFIQKLSDLQVK